MTTVLARRRLRPHCSLRAFTFLGVMLGPAGLASAQDARPRPEPSTPSYRPAQPSAPEELRRTGLQFEFFGGATACLPAEAACGIGGVGLGGAVLPSFGMGVNLGWRPNPYLMIGAAYRFGMFHPGSDLASAGGHRFAHQHGIYAVGRLIMPVGRIDLGVDLGPGYSRVTFLRAGDTRDYSQGFSLLIGPTFDVFLTDRFFIGAKVDLLLNAHYRACTVVGEARACTPAGAGDVLPISQVIYGIHIGGRFGGRD